MRCTYFRRTLWQQLYFRGTFNRPIAEHEHGLRNYLIRAGRGARVEQRRLERPNLRQELGADDQPDAAERQHFDFPALQRMIGGNFSLLLKH